MKKTIYYQTEKNGRLLTEYDVKKSKLNKSNLKKYKYTKREVMECDCFDRFMHMGWVHIGELSTKEMALPEVRKDLMRLGIVW